MSSQNKDILSDIGALLEIDRITPEMERIIGIIRSYRPHVDIDMDHRQRLKKQLMNSSNSSHLYTHRPTWSIWINWFGSSLAALMVMLGIIHILLPERYSNNGNQTFTRESSITLQQSPLDSNIASVPSIQDTYPIETNIQESNIDQIDNSSIQISDDLGVTTIERAIVYTKENISGDSFSHSDNIGIPPMAMPESGMYAKIPTTMSTIPADSIDNPISDEINTEIQDMIWEINTIINQSDSIIIPQYPTEMPIYFKSGVFTPEEESTLVGIGITSTITPTYTPTEIESLIIIKIGSNKITGSPIVHYIPIMRGDQSILVPTVIYTTIQGSTIEIPLVMGY